MQITVYSVIKFRNQDIAIDVYRGRKTTTQYQILSRALNELCNTN